MEKSGSGDTGQQFPLELQFLLKLPGCPLTICPELLEAGEKV